jgi:hypothetical protein
VGNKGTHAGVDELKIRTTNDERRTTKDERRTIDDERTRPPT